AISFCHDGRLATLLRQAHQLNRQHGLVGQRLGQFDFVFLKRALLRETDADDSGNTSGDQQWNEENGADTQPLKMLLEQQQGRIGKAIFHYPMPHRVGVCPTRDRAHSRSISSSTAYWRVRNTSLHTGWLWASIGILAAGCTASFPV